MGQRLYKVIVLLSLMSVITVIFQLTSVREMIAYYTPLNTVTNSPNITESPSTKHSSSSQLTQVVVVNSTSGPEITRRPLYVENDMSTLNTTSANLWCSNGTKLVGALAVDKTPRPWLDLIKELDFVKPGGVVEPEFCKPRHRVAIIIPYRDRETHLKVFVRQMFPILKRQNVRARLVIVEQVAPLKFNRAMLMNIGFTETLKREPDTTCFIFHDVDLLPENDRHPYWCFDQPRHLSVYVDKFRYRLPYRDLMGGATAIPTTVFKSVNGFPNVYWGWGAEDDEFSYRLTKYGYKIQRGDASLARYKMVHHGRDKGNEPNVKRHKVLNHWVRRWKRDGLCSLNGTYLVNNFFEERLYTKFSVKLDMDAVNKRFSRADFFGDSTTLKPKK